MSKLPRLFLLSLFLISLLSLVPLSQTEHVQAAAPFTGAAADQHDAAATAGADAFGAGAVPPNQATKHDASFASASYEKPKTGKMNRVFHKRSTANKEPVETVAPTRSTEDGATVTGSFKFGTGSSAEDATCSAMSGIWILHASDLQAGSGAFFVAFGAICLVLGQPLAAAVLVGVGSMTLYGSGIGYNRAYHEYLNAHAGINEVTTLTAIPNAFCRLTHVSERSYKANMETLHTLKPSLVPVVLRRWVGPPRAPNPVEFCLREDYENPCTIAGIAAFMRNEKTFLRRRLGAPNADEDTLWDEYERLYRSASEAVDELNSRGWIRQIIDSIYVEKLDDYDL